MVTFWWTCPVCFDRMHESPDPRPVERDRDAHLREAHPREWIKPRLLALSWWPTVGVGSRT